MSPGATVPFNVVTVTAGFTAPFGILYDGANIWVADRGAGLLKLNASGAIVQTVAVGTRPSMPIFDGANIWAPNSLSSSVSVVRASTGALVATLTGNGLAGPIGAAFDGQRVLITNAIGDSISLFRAADLTPLGSFPTGAATFPFGACSDGVNFWIAFPGSNQLARF